MPNDVYALAWKLLEKQILKTRRQAISKYDLLSWRLKALEEAVDILTAPRIEVLPAPATTSVGKIVTHGE